MSRVGQILRCLFPLALVVAVCSPALPADEEQQNNSVSPIQISIHPSHKESTRRQVNSGSFTVKVKITNNSDEPVTVWPCLAVQVFDADDKPVKKSMSIGKSGVRFADSQLEGFKYQELAPGKSYEILVTLDQYTYDADFVSGWKITQPGKYRIAMKYEFNRETAKKKYGKGCKVLNEPDRPWNRAVEFSKSADVVFNVR